MRYNRSTMLVYFLRHADADPDKSDDYERKLTPKGLEQSEKVGKFCARYGLVPDLILTSPVVRAKQTAKLVSKKLGGVELIEAPFLTCGMTPDAFLGEVGGLTKFDSVMVVGHEPDFSQTISRLVGLPSSDGIKVRKSSVTAIDLPVVQGGAGRLQFSVPVRLM